ncbi:hypothetical protein JG687_00016888, partial [Phytophthora cactorum]
GSLWSSALGPPPQIPRDPVSRAPRAGLLWLRALAPTRLCWRSGYGHPCRPAPWVLSQRWTCVATIFCG